jgi:hypothetical protein
MSLSYKYCYLQIYSSRFVTRVRSIIYTHPGKKNLCINCFLFAHWGVSDPQWSQCDPDPSVYLKEDPDPAIYLNEDPDLGFAITVKVKNFAYLLTFLIIISFPIGIKKGKIY